MSELVQIGGSRVAETSARAAPVYGMGKTSGARRPPWMRIKIKDTSSYQEVGRLLDGLSLHTVCEEARCPNIWECWGEHRTATFMILGDICTRACRYCAVSKGRPSPPPDPQEPERVAEAVAHLGLAHAVITSVDRDDLEDFGAAHFAATIAAIRSRRPECRVEVLTPDFAGDESALGIVLEAQPEVFGHNIETVPRLYRRMRPKGSYARALELIARVDRYRHSQGVRMTPKSGLMVGLGEEIPEVLEVMDDLRAHGCEVLTIGQYLNPTRRHAPIARFYTPGEFAALRDEGLKRGFLHVVSGPLVRSSYHAHEHVPE